MADRVLEWKSESEQDDEEIGPVRIVDADDPDVVYEEMDWMTQSEAKKLAGQLGLEYTEAF